MASHSILPPSHIIVTVDEQARVLLNPMVILAREHMRRCGFTEEDVQQGSAMRTVGGPERSAWSEARPQQALARDPGAASSEASLSRHERVTVGWGPARHA